MSLPTAPNRHQMHNQSINQSINQSNTSGGMHFFVKARLRLELGLVMADQNQVSIE